MTRNRRNRLITVLFALVSLLFMQLAVASYVCPGTASKVAEVAAMAEADMPCAESMTLAMDESQPNLCQAHCQAGQQTADRYELPAPVVMPIASLGDTALAAFAGNRHRISQDPAQPRRRCNNCWKAWTCLLKAVAAQDVAQVKLLVAVFM